MNKFTTILIVGIAFIICIGFAGATGYYVGNKMSSNQESAKQLIINPDDVPESVKNQIKDDLRTELEAEIRADVISLKLRIKLKSLLIALSIKQIKKQKKSNLMYAHHIIINPLLKYIM